MNTAKSGGRFAVLIAILFTLVTSLLIPLLHPGVASAHPDSSVHIEALDRAHLSYDGREFYDQDTTDNQDYFSAPSKNCPGKDDQIHLVIKNKNNYPNWNIQSSEVNRYYEVPPTTGGGCNDSSHYSVALGNSSRLLAPLAWASSSEIDSVFQQGFPPDSHAMNFIRDDTTKSSSQVIYNRNETGGTSPCLDSLTVNPNDTAHGSLLIRINKSDADSAGGPGQFAVSSSNDSYKNFVEYGDNNGGTPTYDALAAIGKDGSYKTDGGCYVLKTAVSFDLGRTANATKDTGAVNSPAGSTSSGSGGGVSISCETSFFNPLTWIMCPLIDLFQGIINFLDGQINKFLNVPVDFFTETSTSGAGFYAAWASMRTIALVLLVLIGLVMVISQAISIGPFDAYTVKKIMPRLAVAVIGISISWPIMRLLVILSNDVGNAVRGIILAPFSGPAFPDPGLAAGAQGAIGGAFATGFFALGILGMLSFLATAALAVVVAFGVLLIRQIVIALLAILAPIAIIAFVLPNTQKAWKLWWESFSKALLMFPIIAAFIASGRVFAKVSVKADNDAIHQLMAFIAIIIPYFLLPATFRLAGGALSTVGGFVNDRGRGSFDRLKKFRQGQAVKKWEENKAGTRLRPGDENTRFGRFKNRVNTGIQGGTMINKAGFRPGRMRENLGNAIRDTRLESGAKASEELVGAKAFFANDDGMLATMYGGGDFDKTANYLVNEKGYSQDEARKVAARGLNMRRQMGAQSFALTALSRLPGTGTAYKGEEGVESWLKDIQKATGGDKSLAANVISSGKTGFRNAQQFEFSEAGFGDMMQALDMVSGRKLKDDGTQYGNGEVGDFIVSKAYKAVGAGGVVNARNDDSAKAFARAAQRDLQAAVASGDKSHIGRAVAQIENIRDASGQGKRTVTDSYIEELNRTGVRVADGNLVNAVDFARLARESNDPEIMAAYQQVKHDYSLERAGAAAAEGATPPDGTPPVGGGLPGGPGGH